MIFYPSGFGLSGLSALKKRSLIYKTAGFLSAAVFLTLFLSPHSSFSPFFNGASSVDVKSDLNAGTLKNFELTAALADAPEIITPPLSRPFKKIASVEEKIIRLRRGDTIESVLIDFGADKTEARQLKTALYQKGAAAPKRGAMLKIQFKRKADFENGEISPYVAHLHFNNGAGVKYDAAPLQNTFKVTQTFEKITGKSQLITGKVTRSLYQDAQEKGVPPKLIAEFIKVFSYSVDFRDLKKNDNFEFGFETFHNEKSEKIGYGELKYVMLTAGGKKHRLYKITDVNGKSGWFDKTGSSNKRMLMKTPIDGARLSSGFGSRRHPVLGYTRMHRGVDFAAPSGTPIYASGDGVIARKTFSRGFGNYVKIKHTSVYSTAYAHMQSFKKGLRQGMSVRQGDVIGYVGTTGMSTGPHLHYEVHKNGVPINPMSKKLPLLQKANKEFENRFKAAKAEIERLRAGKEAIRVYDDIRKVTMI